MVTVKLLKIWRQEITNLADISLLIQRMQRTIFWEKNYDMLFSSLQVMRRNSLITTLRCLSIQRLTGWICFVLTWDVILNKMFDFEDKRKKTNVI